MQNAFNDEILSEFEAQNPGVDVVFITAGDSMFFGGAAYDAEGFFDRASEYAAKADVLYVDSSSLTPEATRAGFYLDISPLTSSDTTLNPGDFFPAAWESFQWDNGVWALPASINLNLMVYNKTRFDELGLPYPNEAWTIDDFANTVRALSETNDSGEVTTPGFVDWGSSGLLIRSLLGEGVFDDSVLPSTPNMQSPQLEALVTAWSELAQEGHTGNNFTGSSQDIPLRIDGLWVLSSSAIGLGDDEWGVALLPGGVAGTRVQGFAVSAGTQNPELAYELAKFLSSSVEVTTQLFGDSPARQSLVGLEPEDGAVFSMDLPDEAEAIRDQALAVALPASEMRFMEYVNMALQQMSPEAENLDPVSALRDAEAQAIANLQAADERRSTDPILVAQPTPTPILAAGEIAIQFGYTAFISPLPNREQWEQAIQEFVANDPQVGQIVLNTGFFSTDQYNEEGFDCFVQPFNAVPGLDLQTVLNLDPFTNDDPNFNESDFLTGVLPQVQRENMTWAFPLFIQPQVLWYNAEKFDEAGVIQPESGWSIDQFIDALHTLRVNPEEPAPFVPGGSSGNAYILLLAAAFGGLPLDYRTNPPAINFTDPATVDAIRQVLDLAKTGYIEYSALGNFTGGSFSSEQTIYDEALSALSWRLRTNDQDLPDDFEDPYRLTSFPRGTQFTGVSFDTGAGYILSGAESPEACYRWLSYLSTRPDLFTAMPARRSAINTLANQAVQGDDLNAIYNELDTLLQDPTTIIIPSQFSGAGADEGSFMLPIWLNRAFDAYVLEDADLEIELSEAEMFATTYTECINSIERIPQGTLMEMEQEEQLAYFRQFTDCAVLVDPSLEGMFDFSTEE
jgi:ABC-type glycerol-3-phosphate transport system substrate-binding protein